MKEIIQVRKAVFPVAGFGTRFLPATKAMPKELLPILDKPLIQYAAEEAISAGIDTLIFVTGRNKRAIEDHFDANQELEFLLHKKGKSEQAKMVRNILPSGVECIFVRQPEALGLGNAILCAERAVSGEPFAVLLADDFITDSYPGALIDLKASFEDSGSSQILITEVDGKSIEKYGVIVPSVENSRIQGLVEKPKYDEAPSNQAVLGRYILIPEIFEILRKLSPGVGNEVQLSDALNLLAMQGFVKTTKLKGQHFDCGSIQGYINAINHEFEKRRLEFM